MATETIPAKDRRAIKSLYNYEFASQEVVNQQHRDASKSRVPWSKAPTTITVPSNNNQFNNTPSNNNTMYNPFAANRMRNNLDGNNGEKLISKRQKQQTVAGHPTLKRRKVDTPRIASDPQPDTHYNSDTNRKPVASSSLRSQAAPLSRAKAHGSKKEQDVVVISDGDEDEIKADIPDIQWQMDKDATTKHPSRVSSPIEQFPDEKMSPPPGAVKKRVKELEKKSVVVDLKKVKSNMKPRSTKPLLVNMRNHPDPSTNLDPAATSSSFDHSTRFNLNNKEIKTLPCREIFFGLKHLLGGTLSFRAYTHQSQASYFQIVGQDYKEMVPFAQCINSVEIGQHTVEEPCVKFIAKPLNPTSPYQGIGRSWGNEFKPGESGGKGIITIKFNKNDDTWSGETFELFRRLCKGAVAKYGVLIGEPANKAVWDQALASAGTSRDHADDDELNIADDNFCDYDLPPESNERTQLDDELSRREPKETAKYGTRKASSTSNSRAPSSRAPSPGVRRSTRQQRVQAQAKKQPSVDPDEIILTYPQAGVNITNADFNRLLPDEYLNDTLIEFLLKLWHHELSVAQPELANQIHIFNSFFYKKLSSKKAVEEGYRSVQRWTSKFDIFDKKFIIVPINENLHWYLAIIYRPEHVLSHPPEREPPITRHSTRLSGAHEESTSLASTTSLLPEDDLQPLSPSADSTGADVGSPTSRRRSLSITASNPRSSRTGSSELEIDQLNEQSILDSSQADADEAARGLTELAIRVEVEESKSASQSPLSPCVDLPDHVMDVDEGEEEGNSTAQPLSFSSLTTSPHDPRERSRRMDIDSSLSPRTSRKRPLSDDETQANHHKTAPVNPASFYARPPSRKGKETAEEMPIDIVDSDANVEATALETNKTIIFTLDSLGHKHPKAIGTLGKYLQLEANDKKNFDNAIKPGGRMLSVPTQPNFCDCGVYLIHFAQVFVKKAEYFANLSAQKKGTRSSNDRQADWEGERLNGLREELREKVDLLSKHWKAEHGQAQEPEKKVDTPPNEVPLQPEVHDVPESDSDISIVEATPAPASTRKSSRVSRVRG
ncbi:hypothetical protein BDP27DRAFT_1311195 [Rhodocollybia butyracea]|uniref:Ubiquitin-like protease family profile domain-containing protein n=1 Tax=Rhodocollybia butyracea TaxID=206335 RepID=A0A9P5UFQ2_9AGAR|nr:hypothetical protein BDP27DRAFT_1311195 [Rhodocollybia butyracea]